MVPVPAKAESGIQGPASAQTLHPTSASSRVFPSFPPPSALFSALDKFSEFSTYSKELPLSLSPYLLVLPCPQEKYR